MDPAAPRDAAVDVSPPVWPGRRVFQGCGLLLLLLVGTCYACVKDMTTMHVYTYKPAEAVARGDRETLSDRFYGFRDEAAIINLEWFTYDNEVIDRPPYKLFFSIQPSRPGLLKVMVDEVRIRSSQGRTYAFSDTLRWPVTIPIDPQEEYNALLLEPAFMFRHAEGEEITTRIRLRMVTSDGERPVVLETRWKPVHTKRWTSIV